MALRYELRQEECAEEENRSQVLYLCKRRSNSDRWITHPKFLMVARSKLRWEERAKEEKRSQASYLSMRTDHPQI
jgi:hypothetical protein